MTASKHSPHSLRHQFLVASPYLQDPRFHGAVIYLCEHSDEGALGLTVNHPLDIHLGEILEQLDMEGGELDVPVYGGGPVQPERGFVLHSPDAGWQNTAQVADDVLLTTSRDVLSDIGAGRGSEMCIRDRQRLADLSRHRRYPVQDTLGRPVPGRAQAYWH